MKNILVLIFSAILIFGCKSDKTSQLSIIDESSSLKSLDSAPLGVNDLSVVISDELSWNFPVKYGTDEWKSLNTFEELVNALNVPEEILKSVSTEELIKICLAYPSWALMDAYNSRQNGFAIIVGYFNGFRELFVRSDAAKELLKVYDRFDPLAIDPNWDDLQKGEYSFQITKVEMLLNAKPVFDQLDSDDLRDLKEITVSKYQKKKSRPDIYSLRGLSPTVGVCVNILEKENAGFTKDRSDINSFRYYLMGSDIQFLDSIVDFLK